MAFLSPHIREQIRAASDIVEVIGAYLPLRRAGTNFVALCPFHQEKTPSFHVSPSRQAYHCFGCHKGGDVFRFLQDYEHVSFVDAAKRLAERAGIRLEFDESPAQLEERAERDRLRELHEQLTQRWQQVLTADAAGQPGRDYLQARGISPEAQRLFRLGFAPEAWDDTLNWARSKGWDLRLVETAGLIVPRDPSDPARGHYDRFRGRLMFPICDEQGRVIGFSGRILQSEEKTAKYINSPETPIFTKGRVLYGLDKSKRAILDGGSVIICEGQLDMIACYMAGVQNIVAPQGTALTIDHLRILRRYAQEVILCFDSDAAGQKAAARVLDELLASGLAIRVIAVPSPHDPDSYIKANGAEAFRGLVAQARDFFEFYLEFLCSQNDLRTDRGRVAVVEAMATALAKTGNAVLTDRYAQRTAMALAAHGSPGISPDAVRTEFRKRARRPAGGVPQPPQMNGSAKTEETKPSPPPPPQEFWLLKLMLLNEELVGWCSTHLNPEWLSHPAVRTLVEHRLTAQRSGEWLGPAALLGELDDPHLRGLASEALAEGRQVPNQEQQARDLVRQLRNTCLDRRRQELVARVDLPTLSPEERDSLQREINRLRTEKTAPLTAFPSD